MFSLNKHPDVGNIIGRPLGSRQGTRSTRVFLSTGYPSPPFSSFKAAGDECLGSSLAVMVAFWFLIVLPGGQSRWVGRVVF